MSDYKPKSSQLQLVTKSEFAAVSNYEQPVVFREGKYEIKLRKGTSLVGRVALTDDFQVYGYRVNFNSVKYIWITSHGSFSVSLDSGSEMRGEKGHISLSMLVYVDDIEGAIAVDVSALNVLKRQ